MERPPATSTRGTRRGAALLAGISAAVAVAAGAGAATASPSPPLGLQVRGVQAALRDGATAPSGAAAAPTAAPSTAPTPAPTPPTAPPTPPPPPLAVLSDPVRLTDISAGRAGAPAVSADAGILIDVDRRTILWERSPDLPHAPASTTKELTAMVVMSNFRPDQVVTVTPDALHQASDETRLGIGPGQSYTVQELLTAMLMVSANDAATALAVDTVGMDRFVDAMNRQVQALGLRDSHFVTPVGLDDPQQMASARDLAVIGMEDMLHFPLLAQIVRTSHFVMGATAGHPAFTLDNLNRLVDGLYPPALGIKPGWTGNAGPCLVSMAQRGGHRLIAVLLNEKQHLYYDERAMLEWGFAQYGLPNIPNLPEP